MIEPTMAGSENSDHEMSAADVRALHLAILGRPPEDTILVAALAQDTIASNMTHLMTSEEFSDVLKAVAETGRLPDRLPMSRVDMARAATLANELTGSSLNSTAPLAWPDVLHAFLVTEAFAALHSDNANSATALERLAPLVGKAAASAATRPQLGQLDLEQSSGMAGGRSTYISLLGRAPENGTRASDVAQTSTLDNLKGILGSAEFSDILDTLANTGALPPRPPVTPSDWEKAAQWVGRLCMQLPPVPATWPLLLQALLSDERIRCLLDANQADQALRDLDELAAHVAGQTAATRPFLSFNAEWFSRTPAGAAVRRPDGSIDMMAPLSKGSRLPPVLPFFADPDQKLMQGPRSKTFEDLVRSSQAAANDGLLTHWLWDEAAYLTEKALRDVDMPEAAAELEPYLQFLVYGDAQNLSPHPLFSPLAYRMLNADAPALGEGCFADYLLRTDSAHRLTSALFDPDFYLTRQPHVRTEIASGRFASALEHFVRVGMRAGYSFLPDFDRDYYLANHPDLVEALAGGFIPSAEWHFVTSGARENRQPNRFFNPAYYAARYPSAAEEMKREGLASLLEHFLLLGKKRGWRVNTPPLTRDVEVDQGKTLFEKRGRRAYAEALDGVFAIDETPATPALSVIVPISGQADFTAGFLKCAHFAADYLTFKRGVTAEIVVVDNGSKDHTESLLAALPGVKVVRFDRPIGFPAAVNAGVAASNGAYVLVANNDIEFSADGFLRCYDALVQDPSIGVVGAKVILPNETLQEVGSVLDRNAAAQGFGRGQEAIDCRGARFVEVDYASGCFIAFSRADFDALKGLDEAYSPGYYEEVDFSLRMKRDLGKSTVVDTGLGVVHYEHASFAKGRPQTVNESLIIRNRSRLRDTHNAFFASLRQQTAEDRTRKAQTAMSGKARFLVIEDLIPSGLLGSGFGREEEILKIFKDLGIAYDILAFNPTARVDEFIDPLARIYRGWMPGESLDEVLRDHGSRYSHIWLCRTHNIGRAAPAVHQAKLAHGLKVICDTEALSSLRLIQQNIVEGRKLSEAESNALIAGELIDPIGIDLWIGVNRLESDLIARAGLGPVSEIGHAIVPNDSTGKTNGFSARNRMLFIGAVHELATPNYDSLRWFLNDVYSKMNPQTRPKLTIAGHWRSGIADILANAVPEGSFDLVGAVSDEGLARLYSESRVAIAPTRYAAGIPCKVIESVQAGVPIVMTDLLAHQLGAGDTPGLAVGARFDEGVSFAGWLDKLLSDEEAWQTQRQLQTEAIGQRYTHEILASQVKSALQVIGLGV